MLDFRRQFTREVAFEYFFGFFIGKTSYHRQIITPDGNPVKRYYSIYGFLDAFDGPVAAQRPNSAACRGWQNEIA
jgi:hypothetical protein